MGFSGRGTRYHSTLRFLVIIHLGGLTSPSPFIHYMQLTGTSHLVE